MYRKRSPVICALPKGAIEIDYILALSIFLVLFALTVQYVTDYFSTVRESAIIATARSEAISLLGIADRAPEPRSWPQIANITNDLVLLMHFNNDTLDYSSKGNHGTNNGANCSPSVSGRFFSGCSFDGVNDYITTPSQAITPPLTIAAWIKYSVKSDGNVIVSDTSGWASTGFRFYVNTVGTENRNLRYDMDDSGTINANSVIIPGTWQHVAAVHSGGSGTNAWLYVDGAQVASDSVSSFTKTGVIDIGALAGGAGNGLFNGTIDEVAIWNRSLSAAEINALYQQGLKLLGLRTDAFRFSILVNNTKSNLVNQSENATALNLVNELVRFNLSSFGFTGIDYNSVVIYNETGAQIPLQINGSNVTFSANVSANATRRFTVYFDDDSVFGEKSQNVITDADNLTETFFPVEKFYALQYEKVRQLNASNYTNVRSTAGMDSDFRMKLSDADTNATIVDYGGEVPRKGNIVALQRFAVYQNSTGGVNNGKITVQVW